MKERTHTHAHIAHTRTHVRTHTQHYSTPPKVMLYHEMQRSSPLTFRLHAHSLSHSIMTMARDDPWEMMKCFRPATVIPCRSTPRTVGNRGSSLQLYDGRRRSVSGRSVSPYSHTNNAMLYKDCPSAFADTRGGDSV